jgi:biotin carboxyl carrier protein
MEFAIEVGGRVRHVAVNRVGSSFTVSVDGKPWDVDPTLIDPQTLSLLIGHRSYEVTLAPDQASGQLLVHVGSTAIAVTQNGRRRWGRSADGGSGPQRIMAPMPGKVVRVLVQAGEAVQARQPLIVVEAMKMENELKSPKDGKVKAVAVKEGQTVEAGQSLVTLE